jgi:hypothetical protein
MADRESPIATAPLALVPRLQLRPRRRRTRLDASPRGLPKQRLHEAYNGEAVFFEGQGPNPVWGEDCSSWETTNLLRSVPLRLHVLRPNPAHSLTELPPGRHVHLYTIRSGSASAGDDASSAPTQSRRTARLNPRKCLLSVRCGRLAQRDCRLNDRPNQAILFRRRLQRQRQVLGGRNWLRRTVFRR